MRPYIIRNVLVCEEDMIINNEKIAKALEYIKSEDENTTQETLTMCQIPAPSHQEKKKAESASMHNKTNTYLLTLRTTARVFRLNYRKRYLFLFLPPNQKAAVSD